MDISYAIHLNIRVSCIVMRNQGATEVLLLERKVLKDTSFPKGKVNEGESLQDAVTREVADDTGWQIQVLDFVDSYEYINRDEASKIENWDRVYVFLAKPIDYTTGFLGKNEVKGIEWVPIENAKQKVSYENLLPLIEKAEVIFTKTNVQ